MFRKFRALILGIFFIGGLYGCAKPAQMERDYSFYKEKGDQYALNKDYAKAIGYYEDALMRAESPEEASSIQLALADSYFFSEEYADAIPVYEVYLDVYADSPSSDMALLRTGLSYYALMRRPPRDQTPAELAMDHFGKVMKRNPKLAAQYELDKKIADIKERFAEKEFIIAKYYARIRKPEPELLRYKYLAENYPESKRYPEAVYRLIKLLMKSGAKEEAANYLALLEMKSPDSPYVAKAKKIIDVSGQ